MSFHDWARYIIGIEKPYANVEDDSGGETFYGFTSQFLADINEPPPATEEQAIGYLYKHIWEPLGCDDMDWFAAWCYADAVFHHGDNKNAAKCFQAGLRVLQDGKVGPVTRAAAKNIRRTDFWLRYARRRTMLFFAIVEHRPKNKKFHRGWQNRLTELSTMAYRSDMMIYHD